MHRSLILVGILIFAFAAVAQTEEQEAQQELEAERKSRLRWHGYKHCNLPASRRLRHRRMAGTITHRARSAISCL